MGTKLSMTSAYHPQSDCLETYLRYAVGEKPKTWRKWLPMAEWCYNTTNHISIKMTLFEALYGYPPTPFPMPNFSTCKVSAL